MEGWVRACACCGRVTGGERELECGHVSCTGCWSANNPKCQGCAAQVKGIIENHFKSDTGPTDWKAAYVKRQEARATSVDGDGVGETDDIDDDTVSNTADRR